MTLSTTRRRLLAGGVVSAVALAGGGALSWFTLGYRKSDRRFVALSDKEAVVVASLVDAFFPKDGDLPAGADLGLVDRIDEELFSQPAAVRDDVKAAIQLIEHAPPLFGAFGRFSSLDRATRVRVFRALMQRGPDVVVQAAVGLKEIASLAYWSNEKTWGAIGYDGPWQKTPVPPPSHDRWLAAVGGNR